jgi:hypothetical protein
MNLEEILGKSVEPCDCHQCISLTGYIYRIVGTEYRIRMRDKLKCWIGCPWESKVQIISLEDLLDQLPPDIQVNFLFNINKLR